MSEEILKALMQFFAILAKQQDDADEDDGIDHSEEKRKYVEQFLMSELSHDMVAEYLEFYDEKSKSKKKKGEAAKTKMTAVGDSVRILGICKKINKTLTQKQKVVVLVRLLEFLYYENSFTPNKMQIIETAAKVFNIEGEEYDAIFSFATFEKDKPLKGDGFLIVQEETSENYNEIKQITSSKLDNPILILKVQSVNVYFLRYIGESDIKLNNKTIEKKKFYLFASGSIVKPVHDKPIYYSDVVNIFLAEEQDLQLSFVADKITYKFPNGNIGLNEMTISEGAGKLIGIMGASGAGKTTLLSVLSGQEKPSGGSVRINGIDIHKDNSKIEGVIGYVPQDDLLIEELTVFQNLYYNAKLCFKNLSDKEIKKKVLNVIDSLGLSETKHLKVGNPLEKIISGGQRKRLNIGLELIREPSVLFLDEPTSGLSSKDSVNVVDLLRQLALKGKLIFVVIHQPSSEIYKMFDKMVFLDTGGWLTYYGNPVEAISYFKKLDNQVDNDFGDCGSCGTVNSEIVFDILESKVVNEFGELTDKRKVSPQQWHEYYKENFDEPVIDEIKTIPERALFIPNKIKQWTIFVVRDVLSKIANKQYLLITFLEAPALAFILSFIIRKSGEEGTYLFSQNENIPSYLFMSIVVVLFLGLTVSAEEIFRDKKILKREKFLNLSRNSYLLSKVAILSVVSAIQSASFVLVGNSMLEIHGMFLPYFSMLFCISLLANLTGLNISASFNSAVTIYIIIPLLIIPQMILGGAMFSFDKLNDALGNGKGNAVPLIAEFIPARWAYEGLMVDQYVNSEYGYHFYNVDRYISIVNHQSSTVVSLLEDNLTNVEWYLTDPAEERKTDFVNGVQLLHNEIKKQNAKIKSIQFEQIDLLTEDKIDEEVVKDLKDYVSQLKEYYTKAFNKFNKKKEDMIALGKEKGIIYDDLINHHQNEYLEKIITNAYAEDQYILENNEIIQQKDPIYMENEKPNFMGIGAHFFAPEKPVGTMKVATPLYNKIILLLMTLIAYIALYFNWLSKLFGLFSKIKLKK